MDDSNDVGVKLEDSLCKMFSSIMISSSYNTIDAIVEKFGIDKDAAYKIADEKLVELANKIGVPSSSLRSSIKVVNALPDDKTCKFKLIRGLRQGKLCGNNVTKNSIYCSVHKKAVERNTNAGGVVTTKFEPFTEIDGCYRVVGMDMIVSKRNDSADIGIANCLILGHWNGSDLDLLTDDEKTFMNANNLELDVIYDQISKTV